MMQDRDAQARVEGRVSERQFRRFAANPIDDGGLSLSRFVRSPNQQESPGEVEGHGAMASVCEDRRVSSMAGSDIEDPRATRQGIDERPDFGPRFSSPGRERFGDPIIRRADVRFRPDHSSADARARRIKTRSFTPRERPARSRAALARESYRGP